MRLRLSQRLDLILCLTLGACLMSDGSRAATVLDGDYLIAADPNATPSEAGNLIVEGELSVQANFMDFGTTDEPTPSSALTLYYEEDGSNYELTLTASRSAAAFRWCDNGSEVSKPKMKLGSDNVLTLHDSSSGAAKITLDPNTGRIALGTGGGIVLSDGILISGAADFRSTALYDTFGEPKIVVDSTGNLLIQGQAIFEHSVNGYGSVAMGSGVTAVGQFSAAFGADSSALGDTSSAFGRETTADGYAAAAFGRGTYTAGYASVAFGLYTQAILGDASAAFGIQTSAIGESSVAFGYMTSAIGFASAAFGTVTEATGYSSVAFGDSTSASGYFSAAFGISTIAGGYHTAAFGAFTSCIGQAGAAFGVGTVSDGMAQIVVGHYNMAQNEDGSANLSEPSTWEPGSPLFVIGNGTPETRSNAFVVRRNGELRTGNIAQFKGGVRVPPQGDLSMGEFTAGDNPADLDPTAGLLYPGE